MKIQYIVGLAALTALITSLLLAPHLVKSETIVSRETVYVTRPSLSPAQIIWLARLMQCESGLKSGAINPNDLDNTPSYGLLQFKPSTYAAGAKKYGLASTTNYMSPEGQVAIVTGWILDGSATWSQQFPGCTAKLGPPPEKPLT